MGRKKKRKSTDGGESLSHNPFETLSGLGDLPPGPGDSIESSPTPPEKLSRRERQRLGVANTNRGRVDIVRQTAHRGGKAVTVVTGFKGITQEEKKALAKKMQKACGVGGTVKEGRIEIQGENREVVKQILTEAGFTPVFAGG